MNPLILGLSSLDIIECSKVNVRCADDDARTVRDLQAANPERAPVVLQHFHTRGVPGDVNRVVYCPFRLLAVRTPHPHYLRSAVPP